MAGGRAIDHAVLAVRSLDKTAAVYERLGFTLTPRAFHEDRMGTSFRLARFKGGNYIELLEVDRPAKLQPHDFAATSPFFSFGGHNQIALAERQGLSMLVFATNDARADIAHFKAAGLQTFSPFDFERQARLPDGSEATVAFTLGFARSPNMPKIAFFVCEHRAQQYLWKPEFQQHANGAQVIRAAYLISPSPERDAAFISAMFGGEVATYPGGWRVSCGPSQEVRLVTPEAITERDRSFETAGLTSPILAGISVGTDSHRRLTPASEACGMFIEWINN